MEAKRQTKRSWLQKTLAFMLFALFATGAQAQLASVTVSPASTNVSNGDTVTITATGYVTLGLLTGTGWTFSGKSWPANAIATTTGGGILNVDSTITSTLTISHFSSNDVGTYTFKLTGGLLIIVSASGSSTVGTTPVITGVPAGMVPKGFKVQFSGPTGSNLVIQASSDMQHWAPVYTNVMTGGSLTYTDAVARTVSGRFYRAKLK
jgi:hypothetical protein